MGDTTEAVDLLKSKGVDFWKKFSPLGGFSGLVAEDFL